ncbi:MAG: Gfo/Idh/MocA family oxidoreductase [Candidatus Marinimicrobia bacterium]|jgi:predicted dehydrogenase|nr:Gfo/Idh/MocA family oxidoreductase [Candidatus Neomarinimicrobiota bacterium]|tara:strand:- start:86 stop:1078 length:993 start_codon:yes stop_codon:yes gene_type:complete
MKTNKIINIAVIGVGHLGNHHAKHYSQMESSKLIGVFDINETRCNEIAKKYNTKAFQSLDSLLEEADAVSVATPTVYHKEVSETCIKKGTHVFIEKPITKTVKEADELLALAKKHKTIVQVGHIERLNPAILPLNEFDMNPKFIEVQRLAPYMSRGTDVPVVLDLMIHDIDLVLAFVKSSVKYIHASGVSIMTDSVDMANARIRFENGTVASITSSRVAKDRVRKIKIFQQDLYITIDFLIGLTEIYRVMDDNQTDPAAIMSAPLESNGKHRQIFYEKPEIKKQDALRKELENFVESIRGNTKPIVDGQAGRNALDVAIQIHDKILEDLH